MILEGVAIEENAYQKASELWQHPEIDCIFLSGDDMAAGFMQAYEEAVKEQYKFFSFGDAMFIY